MQYKEKIWTYLEREIRKVVHEDSDLMRKVKAKTKILTDCLAEQKVSNVVKENTSLQNDHTKVCKKLTKIIESLSKELMSTVINAGFSGLTEQQAKFRRESLHSIRESVDFDSHPSRLEDKNLSGLVSELEKLVEATLTRLSLAEEECNHFKTQSQDTAHNYQRMKTQFELLSARVKQEAVINGSTKGRRSPDLRTEYNIKAGE